MVSTRRSRRQEPKKANQLSPRTIEEVNKKDSQTTQHGRESRPQRSAYACVRRKVGESADDADTTTMKTQKSSLKETESRTEGFELSAKDCYVLSVAVSSDEKQLSGPATGNEIGTTVTSLSNVTDIQSHAPSAQTEFQLDSKHLNVSERFFMDLGEAENCSGHIGEDVVPPVSIDTDSTCSLSDKEKSVSFVQGVVTNDHNPKHVDNRDQERDNFGWLIQTGRIITIDPLDTIPLTCIRTVVDSGVAKLEVAFLRSLNGPGMSMGFSSAAPQPVVVQIPEDRVHLVVDYFISVKGLSAENAEAISRSKVWFGIVEGAHRRKALINLGEKVPSRFKGYPWVVLCLDWQPLDILRAFARERNEFQRGEHLVDFTVYDIFKNLKQSADEVGLREGLTEGRTTNRGFVKRVADHYCGGPNTANSLTRQLAGIVVALSWPVIEEMGALLNKEYPERARLIAQSTGDATFDYIDARVCRNLFTRSTLRGATTFKSSASEEDQRNTLRRISNLAQDRNYKPITKNELEAMTKKAMAARREVERMQTKLGSHEWPADMISVRETLLTTTLLDDEVEEHEDNNDLLPTFKKLWESLFPITAELESANRDRETDNQASAESSDMNNISVLSDLTGTENTVACGDYEMGDREDGIASTEYEILLKDAERHEMDKSTCDMSTNVDGSNEDEAIDRSENDLEEETKFCPLKQLSLRAENKGWRDLQRNLHSEDLFDFIFADPVQSLSAQDLKQNMWTEFKDDRNIKGFANFCRVSLRPGCYVFIIVLAEEVATFFSALQGEGMKVMKAPFFIIQDANTVRTTRLKDMPQDCGELAVVAKAPGTCSNFSANLNHPYSRLNCTFKRKIGIIDNVPKCQNPLRGAKSRAELRPRERHPDFVAEVIETFCSPTGTVLDVFGGALTTAISCISSRRPCVVLEQDRYCFDLALRRL